MQVQKCNYPKYCNSYKSYSNQNGLSSTDRSYDESQPSFGLTGKGALNDPGFNNRFRNHLLRKRTLGIITGCFTSIATIVALTYLANQ